MKRNDPQPGSENIVQLSQTRRNPLASPRTQAAPIVPFESWLEVRDRAAAALLSGTRRMLLTGPAGTGKTVLIEHTARVLRAAGRLVVIQLADADPAPPASGTTLFVDEADRLSATKLRALEEAAGSVVLVGLDAVARRMPAATVHLALGPLGQEAARGYIATWLAQTGRVPADIDSAAVRRLVELSGGVPRLLSTLLAAAAWLTDSNDLVVIGVAQVQEAAELRSVMVAPVVAASAGAPRRRGRGRASAFLAICVFLGTVAAVAPRLFPVESSRFVDRAFVLADGAAAWVRTTIGRQTAPRSARTQLAAVPGPTVVLPRPDLVPEVPPAVPVALAPVIVPIPAPAASVPAAPAAEVAAVQVPDVQAIPAPALPIQVLPVEPPPTEPVAPPAPEIRAPVAEAPVLDAPVLQTPVLQTPVLQTPVLQTPAPPVIPAASSQAPVLQALSVETIEMLLRRGRQMWGLQDLSAARLLFRRAADAGSGEAMFELAQTFDPAVLTGMGAGGMADAEQARQWYASAAAAGVARRSGPR